METRTCVEAGRRGNSVFACGGSPIALDLPAPFDPVAGRQVEFLQFWCDLRIEIGRRHIEAFAGDGDDTFQIAPLDHGVFRKAVEIGDLHQRHRCVACPRDVQRPETVDIGALRPFRAQVDRDHCVTVTVIGNRDSGQDRVQRIGHRLRCDTCPACARLVNLHHDPRFAKYENRPIGEKKRLVGEAVPYGRMGVPEDHSGAAVFLASADSDYVVAQTLNVDGGAWMS